MNSATSAPTGPTSAFDRYMDMLGCCASAWRHASVEPTSPFRRGLGCSTEATNARGRDRRTMTDYQEQWLMDQAWIDADVMAIDAHTWAIHGTIPVAGEVILAEFNTPEEAHALLDR